MGRITPRSRSVGSAFSLMLAVLVGAQPGVSGQRDHVLLPSLQCYSYKFSELTVAGLSVAWSLQG